MEGRGCDASGGFVAWRRSPGLFSPAPFLEPAALCAAAAPIDSHYLFLHAVLQLQGGKGVINGWVGGGSPACFKHVGCRQQWPDIMYLLPASPLLTKPTIVCRLHPCLHPGPSPQTSRCAAISQRTKQLF